VDDRASQGAEEKDEEQGACGESEPAQRCREGAEADAPQRHPDEVGHRTEGDGKRLGLRREAQGGQQGSPREVEREGRRVVAQPKPDQRPRGRGGADHPDGHPISNPIGKHERKEDGKLPTLKGEQGGAEESQGACVVP